MSRGVFISNSLHHALCIRQCKKDNSHVVNLTIILGIIVLHTWDKRMFLKLCTLRGHLNITTVNL